MFTEKVMLKVKTKFLFGLFATTFLVIAFMVISQRTVDSGFEIKKRGLMISNEVTVVYMWNAYGMSGLDVFPKLRAVYEKFTTSTCNLTRPCHMVLQNSPALGDVGYEQSDLVVFYSGGLETYPPVKSPGQTWMFVGQESPFTLSHIDLKRYDGLFNYTASYQLQTTIPMEFGERKRLKSNKTFDEDFFSMKLKLSATRGRKLSLDSLWIMSNCFLVKSSRNEYVAELHSIGLPIRIFSRSPTKCSKMVGAPMFNSSEVYDPNNFDKYSFYLAFENALCEDYVSEKLWKILDSESLAIPVVLGGKDGRKDYDRVAPPNSFIHVQDYKSPKELVEYLKRVVSEPELFNSYHEWRKTYYAGSTDRNHQCEYCRLAQEKPANVINDFSQLFSLEHCVDVTGKSCESLGACSLVALGVRIRLYYATHTKVCIIIIVMVTLISIAALGYAVRNRLRRKNSGNVPNHF